MATHPSTSLHTAFHSETFSLNFFFILHWNNHRWPSYPSPAPPFRRLRQGLIFKVVCICSLLCAAIAFHLCSLDAKIEKRAECGFSLRWYGVWCVMLVGRFCDWLPLALLESLQRSFFVVVVLGSKCVCVCCNGKWHKFIYVKANKELVRGIIIIIINHQHHRTSRELRCGFCVLLHTFCLSLVWL